MTRILVIANAAAATTEVVDAICAIDGAAETLVVAPALNTRLRHWLSDEDEARRAARARLGVWLERLAERGIEARGWIGDPDPLQAIADALRLFPAEKIVVAMEADGRPHWLARDLVGRARARYPHPVHQVVAA